MVRTTAANWTDMIRWRRAPTWASSFGTQLNGGNPGGHLKRQRRTKRNKNTMARMDDKTVRHAGRGALHRLGPISLLLASAALVAASIPYLRVLALPLSSLGIILGASALMSADKRKSGMVLPLAGGVASVAVFFLAGFWLDQFAIILGGWRKSPASEQKTVPLRN